MSKTTTASTTPTTTATSQLATTTQNTNDSTEELSDMEFVALALGLFLILVLAYLIIDGCRKGKKNQVNSDTGRGVESTTATRVQVELQNTEYTGIRMTQGSPQNDIEVVLNLPPSYEEALRTSAADDSAFREVTVGFGFSDCNRNGGSFSRTISLPPPYEDAIHNTSTSAHPAASSNNAIDM